jgi:hypothetical protein
VYAFSGNVKLTVDPFGCDSAVDIMGSRPNFPEKKTDKVPIEILVVHSRINSAFKALDWMAVLENEFLAPSHVFFP